jgi:hypothetical protein
MAHPMRRDPIARGEYERVCHGPGECAWCGQIRPRVFSYAWVNDGLLRNTQREHANARTCCNFNCFQGDYL